jgi:putative integral membrane protein (TIGR02587 family)
MAGSEEFDRESYVRTLVRAAAGGLVFGMPLLYTMEVWWSGFVMPWWKILLLLAVGAAVAAAFARIEGFRRDRTLAEALWDTAVGFGLAIVIATAMLVLLGQLDGGASLREWVGKIAVETVPIAIGVSVARALLGEAETDSEAKEPGPLGQGLVAAGGALFFALNVAPTEEPMIVGIRNDWWLMLLLLAVMGVVSFAIVFYADFRGSHRRRRESGPVSPVLTPLGETVVSIAAALVVSALLLWFFGRIGPGVGGVATVQQVVALGLVAVVGSSAARLLL